MAGSLRNRPPRRRQVLQCRRRGDPLHSGLELLQLAACGRVSAIADWWARMRERSSRQGGNLDRIDGQRLAPFKALARTPPPGRNLHWPRVIRRGRPARPSSVKRGVSARAPVASRSLECSNRACHAPLPRRRCALTVPASGRRGLADGIASHVQRRGLAVVTAETSASKRHSPPIGFRSACESRSTWSQRSNGSSPRLEVVGRHDPACVKERPARMAECRFV